MQRFEDWDIRLGAAFEAAQSKPFAWGDHDCMTHACTMIHAMTGVDPYADFRGKYKTSLGALKQIKARGSETLLDLVEDLTEKHGMKEIPVAFAQRGDLVYFDVDQYGAFAIVHHNGIHTIGVGESGLMRLKTLDGKRAWRV